MIRDSCMNNRTWWRRLGDFYSGTQHVSGIDYARRALYPVMVDGVTFRNAAPAKVIMREISIMRYSDGDTRVDLTTSPFRYDELLKTCKLFFTEEEFELRGGISDTINLKFAERTIPTLIKMLHFLNKQFSTAEFSEDLLSELIHIHGSLEINPKNFYAQKHVLGEGTISNAHVNPERKDSHHMLKLLQYFPAKGFLKDLEISLKKYLVKGEDPNQKNGLGETPLSLGLNYDQMTLFLLLCYGANPWEPTDFSGLSAIEIAKKYYKPEKYDYLIEACSRSEAKPNKFIPRALVESTHMFLRENKIVTYIQRSDQSSLVSELKKMQQLTDSERLMLFSIYKLAFKAEVNAQETFAHSFSPDEGKLIDILRDKNGRIVGADTFIVRKTNKEIFILIDLSFLHPDQQGCGFMPFIDYRLPFALQQLYLKHQVSILFTAASYNALKKIEKTLFFPKFQPDGMKEKVKQIFTQIFNYPLTWIDAPDGIFFIVREKNQVSATPRYRPASTLLEEFYYNHLSGIAGYIPVLVQPGHDLLSILNDQLAPMNINFQNQYQQLAKTISTTKIIDINGNQYNGDGSIYNSDYAFWSGKKVQFKNNSSYEKSLLPESKKDLVRSKL